MKIRNVTKADWPSINYLASNEVQEGDHSVFESEWTTRRRDPSINRYSFVIESSDEIVCYAALEEVPGFEGFRMFLVTDWSKPDQSDVDLSVSELERIARENNIYRL